MIPSSGGLEELIQLYVNNVDSPLTLASDISAKAIILTLHKYGTGALVERTERPAKRVPSSALCHGHGEGFEDVRYRELSAIPASHPWFCLGVIWLTRIRMANLHVLWNT